MDALHIALIVLAIVGVWAVVELALTFRKTRSTVDELTKQVTEVSNTANETIEQVQPIIARMDTMVTELEPSVQQIDPLIKKVSTAVDVVTVDLASVNDILVDVSSVTDTASNVTSTVSKAANSAVSGVAGVVGKFTGGGKASRRRKLADKSTRTAADEGAASEQAPDTTKQFEVPAAYENDTPRSSSYFVYGDESAGE